MGCEIHMESGVGESENVKNLPHICMKRENVKMKNKYFYISYTYVTCAQSQN